ncbi:hypothetical protein ES703_20552 [subsurface metagenome]
MIDLASKMTKIAVPKSLEMAIIKIRAEQELDWEAACEHMAELSDPNGKKFKQAVSREANRRYKSRHLSELNKAKAGFIRNGYEKGIGEGRSELNTSKESFIREGYDKGLREGQSKGRKEGNEEATNKWRISYPCNVCGKPLSMTPGNAWHKVIAEYLKSRVWGHRTCHAKQRQNA